MTKKRTVEFTASTHFVGSLLEPLAYTFGKVHRDEEITDLEYQILDDNKILIKVTAEKIPEVKKIFR